MCFALYLLSEYSCSLLGSTPVATPSLATPSFLLCLLQHSQPSCVLLALTLALPSLCLAWRLAEALIISLQSQPGGEHLRWLGGRSHVWW